MLPVFKTRSLPGLFDEFFNGNLLPNYIEEGAWKSTPAVNIYETNEKFEIEIAAPGLEKDDFKIDLKNDYLLVYSEKKDKKEEKEKGKVVRSEFRYSSFQRSFALPKDIDATAIQATHKNGVLVIELPKKVEQKDSLVRQIEIQ
ncbi:small heat shock protein [Aquipluma nitroreducens]|jgi:HSP20 family protein|uniref:Small heat shock protein n=1 Tax=Aquipluma nitroreducens TaxID=2010828 RepID=A0A5K7SCE5_9BACT|nr:Hsp20/alpha crystallin family protein [Aquipluma nitroreducens]BBE19139.1 small heat shock protein [Aquipluma nitroreducens]